MRYRVTFHTKRARARLSLPDKNEDGSCLVTLAERSPICRSRVLDCEDKCSIP